MAEAKSKIMTAKEAISKFVHNGDHLVIGNYIVGSCADSICREENVFGTDDHQHDE